MRMFWVLDGVSVMKTRMPPAPAVVIFVLPGGIGIVPPQRLS
jgi:hypothetical protein